MRTYFMRAVGAVVAVAALAAFGLAHGGGAGAAAATGSPTAGQAAKVPAGFQLASASFRSAASGVVLGGVGCTPSHVCPALLAATADGGAHWHLVAGPDVWITEPAAVGSRPQVNQVVFASGRDGWLYDQYDSPRLWATHDGGAHWRATSLSGDIETMAASAGTVYAVVRHGAYGELFSSPASHDAWARVGTMTGSNLAVFGKAAWFGTSTAGTSTYLWATADGAHWRKYPFSCPAGLGLGGIAAASSWQVAFLCGASEGTYHSAKEVLLSVNGGRTEHLTGQAPIAGYVAGFAVPPSRAAVITIAVITPGLSYLYRSANGGKTWAEIAVSSLTGGVSFTSLSYVSPTVGWVVISQPGIPGLHQLLRTSDAGRTWHAARF